MIFFGRKVLSKIITSVNAQKYTDSLSSVYIVWLQTYRFSPSWLNFFEHNIEKKYAILDFAFWVFSRFAVFCFTASITDPGLQALINRNGKNMPTVAAIEEAAPVPLPVEFSWYLCGFCQLANCSVMLASFPFVPPSIPSTTQNSDHNAETCKNKRAECSNAWMREIISRLFFALHQTVKYFCGTRRRIKAAAFFAPKKFFHSPFLSPPISVISAATIFDILQKPPKYNWSVKLLNL